MNFYLICVDMANSRFFHNNGPISLQEIIAATGAMLLSPKDALIEDVAPLETATQNHLSFFINSKYIQSFKESKAGFCFVASKHIDQAPSSMNVLVHENPYKAYAIAARMFYNISHVIPDESEAEDRGSCENKLLRSPACAAYSSLPGMTHGAQDSQMTYIAKTAKIGKNCQIGNFVVIEDDVEIGDDSVIDHNTVIKRAVIIGKHAKIASNVTISHAIIGDNVIIHPGCRIGQDGFGFASDHTGHLKVPQLGIVRIGNFVDIGANTTIDRGSAQDTEIADMTQIDNLVQIGHNVKIGKACVIVAQVGIAGSTKLGNFVVLGGQVGVSGHLNIGDQAQVAAQSGVTQNVEAKQIMGGYPAVPVRQWHKQTINLKQLANKSN
jgi:UDP-3-O-[3-hydroxymyristoyl] glucosamine N-acyltransferase